MPAFILKLRRLADTLDQGEFFEIRGIVNIAIREVTVDRNGIRRAQYAGRPESHALPVS